MHKLYKVEYIGSKVFIEEYIYFYTFLLTSSTKDCEEPNNLLGHIYLGKSDSTLYHFNI